MVEVRGSDPPALSGGARFDDDSDRLSLRWSAVHLMDIL